MGSQYFARDTRRARHHRGSSTQQRARRPSTRLPRVKGVANETLALARLFGRNRLERRVKWRSAISGAAIELATVHIAPANLVGSRVSDAIRTTVYPPRWMKASVTVNPRCIKAGIFTFRDKYSAPTFTTIFTSVRFSGSQHFYQA